MGNKSKGERLHEMLTSLFDHVETITVCDVREKLEKTSALEDAIVQAINESTVDDTPEQGIVLVALMNVLAGAVVGMCVKEPPEVPAPVLSLEAVKNGLKMVNEAMASFTAASIREAEADGCTIAMRFRPQRHEDPDEATETAPSAAPEAAGPLRDAQGATEGAPPAYDRDRDNPLTDETSFGGAKASGTEG